MDVYENTKKFYDKYNIIICILCLLFFVIEGIILFILGMSDDSNNDIIVASGYDIFVATIYANFVFVYPITVFVLSIVGYVKQKKRNIKNKLAVINIIFR